MEGLVGRPVRVDARPQHRLGAEHELPPMGPQRLPFDDRAGYEPLLPAARAATEGLEGALAAANTTLRYVQWRDHGYGIVHLTPGEAVLEHWWQPILEPSTDEQLGAQHRVVRGTDHVERVISPAATCGRRVSAPAPELVLRRSLMTGS